MLFHKYYIRWELIPLLSNADMMYYVNKVATTTTFERAHTYLRLYSRLPMEEQRRVSRLANTDTMAHKEINICYNQLGEAYLLPKSKKVYEGDKIYSTISYKDFMDVVSFLVAVAPHRIVMGARLIPVLPHFNGFEYTKVGDITFHSGKGFSYVYEHIQNNCEHLVSLINKLSRIYTSRSEDTKYSDVMDAVSYVYRSDRIPALRSI